MEDKRKLNSGRTLGSKSDLLTKEEMDKLIGVVSDNLFYTTLYKMLRYSGRRIGEVYGTYINKKLFGGIKLEDIDFENKRIKTLILKTQKIKLKRKCINCGKTSITLKAIFCRDCGTKLEEINKEQLKEKNLVERYLPMRDELCNSLKLYISTYKFKNDDYIFRIISLKQIQKKIKEHIKKAGINKNFTLHGFRHYFITNLIKEGLNEEEIIKWTGHTDINSLTKYNQLVPNDIKDKVNNIDL